MKKVLDHFVIGESYGGNQDWFEDLWMNRGGCGAVTAVESCIVLARNFGLTELCPVDPWTLTREDYIKFSMRMKPYLRPRPRGICKTSLYMDGFRDYLAAVPEVGLRMMSVEGDAPYGLAASAVKSQIDAGFPVPYLMLLHHDRALEDYNWHWFLLNAYEEREDGRLFVRAVTYGESEWLEFRNMWNTGNDEKGGFVCYSLER